MKRPTPAELDRLFAHSLLLGSLDGKREFPSRKTSPTEKDARQALARILRSGDVPTTLLRALADQIDPEGHQFRLRRIEFKNLTQGHPKSSEHFHIAKRIYDLRKNNEKNAVDKVAKEIGKDSRHVAKIYARYRDDCEKFEQFRMQLEKDGFSLRTDAMASDK